MAATFGGNRLEAGIHTCGYPEVDHQAIQFDESNAYFFSFLRGSLRKHHMPELNPSKPPSKGGVTASDVEEAVLAAKDAEREHRWTTIAERKNLLRRILNAPFMDSNTLLNIDLVDTNDRQKAMRTIEYYIHLFTETSLKSSFIYESNVEQRMTTSVVNVADGVIGVLLSGQAKLSTIAGIVAPAIMCGCSLVLKISHSNPFVGYIFAKILEAAKLPNGLIALISGPGDVLGKTLISHQLVSKVAYVGSIETASKLKHSIPFNSLRKIAFQSSFTEQGVCCLLEDLDLTMFRNQFRELMFALTTIDAMSINQTIKCNHVFVHASQWDKLVVLVKQQMDTLGNVANLDYLFHARESEQRDVIENDKTAVFQFKQYVDHMVQHGVAIYSTISEDRAEQAFVTLFSDTLNPAALKYVDINGTLIHFHKCCNDAEVLQRANQCLDQTGAFYTCIFVNERSCTESMVAEAASSVVLFNTCHCDVAMKLSDHDVVNFFVRKKTVLTTFP